MTGALGIAGDTECSAVGEGVLGVRDMVPGECINVTALCVWRKCFQVNAHSERAVQFWLYTSHRIMHFPLLYKWTHKVLFSKLTPIQSPPVSRIPRSCPSATTRPR